MKQQESAGSLAIDNMTYVVVALRQPWAIDLQTPPVPHFMSSLHCYALSMISAHADLTFVHWFTLHWQYHGAVLAVFGLALVLWGEASTLHVCTRSWLSVFSGGHQHQTRDNETNGPFSLIIHKWYIILYFVTLKSLNGNDLKMRNKNFTSAQMIN